MAVAYADESEGDDEEEEEEEEDADKRTRLPAIGRPPSRGSEHEDEDAATAAQEELHAMLSAVASPSSSGSSSAAGAAVAASSVTLPPLRPRAMTTLVELPKRPSFQRQATLSKVQLKLKETVIGDELPQRTAHRSQSLT
ncbi:hypothetical protein PINS_up010071 [Pythium insidiosum]|nr:hypothetical protein PINS_up010071 [Pythium insidiosum]